MKKIIVLMTSLLLLTGCVKVSFTGPKKEEKTSQSTSSKKEPLTFVRADQYKDQDNEVLEASEKFIKEHPTLGEPGKLFVFFPGYTFGNEESRFALFFIVNRTTTTIDRDGSFVLNWNMIGSHFSKMSQLTMKSMNQCIETEYGCSYSYQNHQGTRRKNEEHERFFKSKNEF